MAKGVIETECFVAGGGNVGLDVGLAIGQMPAIAKASLHIAHQRIIDPYKLKCHSAKIHFQIHLLPQIGSGFIRRIDFYKDLRLRAAPAHVSGSQGQIIETVGHSIGIDLIQNLIFDGNITFCQNGKFIRAQLSNLKLPVVQIVILYRSHDIGESIDQSIRKFVSKAYYRGRVILGITDFELCACPSLQAVGIRGNRFNKIFAGSTGYHLYATHFIKHQWLTIYGQT